MRFKKKINDLTSELPVKFHLKSAFSREISRGIPSSGDCLDAILVYLSIKGEFEKRAQRGFSLFACACIFFADDSLVVSISCIFNVETMGVTIS